MLRVEETGKGFDFATEIGLELVRALVFRHDGKHFFEGFYFLFRGFAIPEALFSLEIHGGQIGRHVTVLLSSFFLLFIKKL